MEYVELMVELSGLVELPLVELTAADCIGNESHRGYHAVSWTFAISIKSYEERQ